MKLLTIVSVLLLSGCGPALINVTPIPRTTPLYTGFYGASATQAAETATFTNFYWESWFSGEAVGIANILLAAKPTVIDINPYLYTHATGVWTLSPTAQSNVVGLFTRLQTAGVLKYIKWLYPIDEPDINLALSDQAQGNVIARQAAAQFPELAGIKLAVIFSGVSRLTRIGDYDLVGFDDYSSGSGIFNDEYGMLVNAMSPGQQIILVPGGANPWSTPPFEFYSKAALDGRIAMIAAFIWFDDYGGTSNLGIKSNGMANTYCTAGMTAMDLKPTC